MRRVSLLFLLLFLAGCRTPALPGGGDVRADVPPGQTLGTLQVEFLDVGQGDAALVRIPGGKSLLVDGGPSGSGPRVVEALRAAEIRSIDWLVASHPHEDHIGGLIDVLEEIPAKVALDSGYNHGTATQKKYLSLLKQVGAQGKLARVGGRYELGSGAVLEILAPQEPLLTGTDSDPNNNSVVARLVFGATEFLFTGDMEEDERARLLGATAPEQLRSDVLKVAHHGSHNGTDPDFLRDVRPQFAVISCATGNDYGHPHKEAVQALQSAGCSILRTDQLGTIRFQSDGRKVTVASGKQEGSAAPANDGQSELIGNRESEVFHTSSCSALPSGERRVTFGTTEQARKAGYRPHRACVGEGG